MIPWVLDLYKQGLRRFHYSESIQYKLTTFFLRVRAGTAKRVLAAVIMSVRLSVRPSFRQDPVPNQAQVR